MAMKTVVDAVYARLAANWAATDIDTTGERGETAGAAFITVQFPVSNISRLSISDRLYREEGAFRIVINAERGDAGVANALTWADQLAALFRDVSFGGVQCLVPSSPAIGDFNDEGMYFVTTIVCPYTYDFQA